MATLPTNRTTSNNPTEHKDDHNTLHSLWNISTTKGDLIGTTGAQAYVRVPVGTNGASLVADSTQASGLNWQTLTAATRLGWHVTRNAVQSIPTGLVTPTNISWDTEIQDTPANFTPPSTTLTIPSGGDGLWFITAQLNYATSGVTYGVAIAQVVAGGITFRANDSDDVNMPAAPALCLTVVVPLVATNTIIVSTLHNSGVNRDITGRLLAYKVGS